MRLITTGTNYYQVIVIVIIYFQFLNLKVQKDMKIKTSKSKKQIYVICINLCHWPHSLCERANFQVGRLTGRTNHHTKFFGRCFIWENFYLTKCLVWYTNNWYTIPQVSNEVQYTIKMVYNTTNIIITWHDMVWLDFPKN